MGLYNRGRAVTGMYLDGKPVIRAYLGDRLVWDGSRSAFVSVPRIGVVMSALTPEVSASSSVAVGVAAMAMSAGAPSVTATALVAIPSAAMALVVPAPVVHADANVSVEVVTIAMQALPAVGAVGADATVAVPAAAVTMSAPAPTVAAHFDAAIPVVAVTMSAPAPVVTATGSAVVAVGVAEMMVAAKAPVVTASSSVVVPVSTIGMSAKAPVVTASSTVVVPAIAVTMAAKSPVIQTGPTILVTDNFNRTAGALTTPWTRFVSWFQDSYQITATGTVKRNSGGTASGDGFDGYIHGTALPGQNQYASLWVTAFGSSNGNPGPGLILRAGSTSAPALMGQVYYNTWRIIAIAQVGAGGTPVVLKSGTGSFTAGGKIEMSVRNVAGVDTVSLSYNGVVLDTYSGTGLPTGLYHGFSTGEATNQVDDYAAGTP